MSVHIKKIDKVTSFCGLNKVEFDTELKGYNVIFANNGAGKTSITRALELLIKENTHIAKYQTINSSSSPEVSFELENSSVLINEANILPQMPFKIEIYNSDFLIHNAPLNSEFGLKKLDDQTIILEGSAIGEETKKLKGLNKKNEALSIRKEEIGSIDSDDDCEIKKASRKVSETERAIEKVRSRLTSTTVQVRLSDITISNNDLSKQHSFDEHELLQLQNKFDALNAAIKKFETLESISLPTMNLINKKEELNTLFEFDIQKEAGEVSDKIKHHILQVGEKFIKDGRKIVSETSLSSCPFCTQTINNNILSEYANYFNKAVEKFDSSSQEFEDYLTNDIKRWEDSKATITSSFEAFRPFIETGFDKFKNNLETFMKDMVSKIKGLKELITLKKGVQEKASYTEYYVSIDKLFKSFQETIALTTSILEGKKNQIHNLQKTKSKLKSIKVLKAKNESLLFQKTKYEAEQEIKELEEEFLQVKASISKNDAEINKIQAQRRPDVQVINSYLKALNLSKYSINKDYQITVLSSVVKNEHLMLILSEGEKTTIAFAYFLARLKLFYNKDSLKELLLVIDDPISSLDESRIYNTSHLVAKINQEIAGEIVKEETNKAQVCVFTHSHAFMTNIIRILGKHASYFQLIRSGDLIEFSSKQKVAGYFDTYFLMLFKEIFQFSSEISVTDDFNKAINHGNKIRILLESFMKINFISEFLEKEYRDQNPFSDAKINNIIKIIQTSNKTHEFTNSYFKDGDYLISNEQELKTKLGSVIKGLHMDSHGSISDFYTQYKTSLSEVQNFAKVAINVMTALNPNQTYFYIEEAKKC